VRRGSSLGGRDEPEIGRALLGTAEEIADRAVPCRRAEKERMVSAGVGQDKAPRLIGGDDGLPVRYEDVRNRHRPALAVA